MLHDFKEVCMYYLTWFLMRSFVDESTSPQFYLVFSCQCKLDGHCLLLFL